MPTGTNATRSNRLNGPGATATSTGWIVPSPKSSSGTTSKVTTLASRTTAQSVADSSRRALKARQTRRRSRPGFSRTGRTLNIPARLCVRSPAGRCNQARKPRTPCSNAPEAASRGDHEDNTERVSYRSHADVCELPECEFFSAGPCGRHEVARSASVAFSGEHPPGLLGREESEPLFASCRDDFSRR